MNLAALLLLAFIVPICVGFGHGLLQAEVKVVFPLKHFWNVDAVRREEDDEGRRGR